MFHPKGDLNKSNTWSSYTVDIQNQSQLAIFCTSNLKCRSMSPLLLSEAYSVSLFRRPAKKVADPAVSILILNVAFNIGTTGTTSYVSDVHL